MINYKGEKWCPACRKFHPLDEFYKNGNKYSTYCKKAKRDMQKQYRSNNRDKVNEYEQNRRKDPKRKDYLKKYTRDYRHFNKDRAKKYDKKADARRLVNHLIKYGVLKQATKCEITGSTEFVQYHHYDYDYPDIVIAVSHRLHESIHKPHLYTSEEDIKERARALDRFKELKKLYTSVSREDYFRKLQDGF